MTMSSVGYIVYLVLIDDMFENDALVLACLVMDLWRLEIDAQFVQDSKTNARLCFDDDDDMELEAVAGLVWYVSKNSCDWVMVG